MIHLKSWSVPQTSAGEFFNLTLETIFPTPGDPRSRAVQDVRHGEHFAALCHRYPRMTYYGMVATVSGWNAYPITTPAELGFFYAKIGRDVCVVRAFPRAIFWTLGRGEHHTLPRHWIAAVF